MSKLSFVVAAFVVVGCGSPQSEAEKTASLGQGLGTARVNAVLAGPVTDAYLAELNLLGKVTDVIPVLHAVTVQGQGLTPETLLALPFVLEANYDAERSTGPVSTMAADFSRGYSMWNLDAINVLDGALDQWRDVPQTGAGVYVAVLDTGLVDNWRYYFPPARVAVQFAKSFGGGGGENGAISEQPNKWEHDQNSHGTHVTSTILGFNMNGSLFNGVAPSATVIPVKVLNQNGSGWSSMIAAGIVYVADLKLSGVLGASPVVINMSLGGPYLDAIEKAAIDYAVGAGVVIVAAAGNEGLQGMGYPGAYPPVISAAATGYAGQWQPCPYNGQMYPGRYWWQLADVPDPTAAADFYIAKFSSRKTRPNHDLDVAAPGALVVGPYQVNGQVSYYFLGGTSMASPHVAGAVALLLQKNPGLTAAQAEAILESSAVTMGAGSRTVLDGPAGPYVTYTWGTNATGSGLLDAAAALSATPLP